jgi:hypothetical protein
MRCFRIFLFFLLVIFPGSFINGLSIVSYESRFISGDQDTLNKQILFNGRAWRNLYSNVKGDQFLFSGDFYPGTVIISGRSYSGIRIRYDILKDELLTITGKGIIVQLNKEMVDAFTMDVNGRTWHFLNLDKMNIMNGLQGYVNVLYNGSISLFVKYKKEVMILAEENKYDVFQQSMRIYVSKAGILYPVNGKNDLLRLYKKDKQEIRGYLKSNKLKVSKKRPDSFIPLVEFCDKVDVNNNNR